MSRESMAELLDVSENTVLKIVNELKRLVIDMTFGERMAEARKNRSLSLLKKSDAVRVRPICSICCRSRPVKITTPDPQKLRFRTLRI